jgi:hypothetical protein
MKKIFYSFVVDALPLHYYQAELLLYSLEKNGGVDRREIVVQCVEGVDADFVEYLEEKGYSHTRIKPYLDGKYCNKLNQLACFENREDVGAVVLMDTDMFVLERLAFDGTVFGAKIVDAPNPSLQTLIGIYEAAGLKVPPVCDTDWKIEDAKTFANNFNGGLYVIPANAIAALARSWKKWAEWLFDKEALFEFQRQMIHIDQIAMGMALAENGIAYRALKANDNAPVHHDANIRSLDCQAAVRILHYHRQIDAFGFIDDAAITERHLQAAIAKANRDIYEKKRSRFYERYSRSLIPDAIASTAVDAFEKKVAALTAGKKFRLFIHAGTPKTGTTSLQFFLDNNRELLEKAGYFYPHEYIDTPAPKHQWLVSHLMHGDLDSLYAYAQKIYNQALEHDGVHTIVLSTEGVYNHWWDYPLESKMALRALSNHLPVKMMVFFREPISFLDSLYKQYLKNPKVKNIEPYGKDLSFAQMYRMPWFKRHLDYLGFVNACRALFGEEGVAVFKYSSDVIKTFCDYCEIPMVNQHATKIEKKNKAQSAAVVELLRIINRYDLRVPEKQEAVKILSKLDGILARYSPDVVFAKAMEKEINMTVSLQAEVLETEFNLKF